MKTKGDHLKELQTIFNSFIRKRDEGKLCISCLKLMTGKIDAGHFYSVGAYPNLRFNEDNVHAQCNHCNTHNHGNIAEYSINLPYRIGAASYEALGGQRREPLKLSIPEIIDLKQVYRDKIKELLKEQK